MTMFAKGDMVVAVTGDYTGKRGKVMGMSSEDMLIVLFAEVGARKVPASDMIAAGTPEAAPTETLGALTLKVRYLGEATGTYSGGDFMQAIADDTVQEFLEVEEVVEGSERVVGFVVEDTDGNVLYRQGQEVPPIEP